MPAQGQAKVVPINEMVIPNLPEIKKKKKPAKTNTDEYRSARSSWGGGLRRSTDAGAKPVIGRGKKRGRNPGGAWSGINPGGPWIIFAGRNPTLSSINNAGVHARKTLFLFQYWGRRGWRIGIDGAPERLFYLPVCSAPQAPVLSISRVPGLLGMVTEPPRQTSTTKWAWSANFFGQATNLRAAPRFGIVWNWSQGGIIAMDTGPKFPTSPLQLHCPMGLERT